MNNIKKLFVSAILCYVTGNVKAQEPQGDPFQYNPSEKMFLPTPEQASLLKFIDIPAGSHTGVLGYSVPIYTIEGKDFSLPISIDYHGGGIKVDELSGSVGIGWALNIGGISLSEEVRGERDLDNTIEKLDHFDPIGFDPSYGEPSEGGSTDYWDAMKMTGIQTTGMPGVPEAELQPDYFSYSLLNNTGRFIRDNNNKVHTVPKDEVTIPDFHYQGYPQLYKQQITDKKGVNYYFSSYQQEHAPGNQSTSFEPRKRFSYKIDSIVVPKSGTVKFDYYEVSYDYLSSRSKTKKLRATNGNFSEEPTGISETVSTITEQLPKSLTYNNVKVNFNYKKSGGSILGRLDVNEGGASTISKKGAILENIEVVDTGSNKKIKEFKLVTDYFNNDNTSGVLSKRLKLVKIHNLLEETFYEFKYIGEDSNKYLPPRFSYSQDYWGMYNGKYNSTSVPEFLYNAGQKSLYFPGANKHPDEDFAEIGSLGEVKLPTGGYQVFEYELDEFRNTDFDDYNYLPVHNFQEMHFEIIGGDTHSFNVNYPILAEEDSSVDFTKGYNYNFYFDYANNPNIDLEDGEIPMGGITYYVAKIVKDGNELPMNIYGGTFTLPDDFFVQGSDYSVIIRKVGSGTIAPFATFGSIWVHDYITYPQNRQAGTLRVKSITLLDSGRQDLIKRSYKYTDFDDSLHPEISSGVFTATKPFPWFYITSYEEYPENHPPITYSFLHIPDNGLRNLNSSFGKSVIYQKVTETYVSTKEGESLPNHKKEYVFSLPPEQSPQMAVPNLPLPHTDYLGGLILEQRMKNEQNQLVKLITNSYNNVNPDMYFNQFSSNYSPVYDHALSPALAVANKGFRIVYIASLPMMIYLFDKNYSHIYSGWIKHLSTTEKNYENGLLKMTNTTEYEYDNTYSHLNPVRVTTTNSLGQQIKTEYTYNHPYKKDEPTTVVQYEDGNPVSVQKTTFNSADLPQYVFAKKASETLDSSFPSEDLKITYDRYDSNGNLQQYTLADGTPVSIIWGYNGQYPIAKVEGVAYSAIETQANGLSANQNLTESSFDALRTLVNSSANYAMLTCYIYEPLVGVKMIILPNGQKEIYEYDNAGRLIKVKDHNGKELKKTDYHYYNQP